MLKRCCANQLGRPIWRSAGIGNRTRLESEWRKPRRVGTCLLRQFNIFALVAELADATDLKSVGLHHTGSNPVRSTIYKNRTGHPGVSLLSIKQSGIAINQNCCTPSVGCFDWFAYVFWVNKYILRIKNKKVIDYGSSLAIR